MIRVFDVCNTNINEFVLEVCYTAFTDQRSYKSILYKNHFFLEQYVCYCQTVCLFRNMLYTLKYIGKKLWQCCVKFDIFLVTAGLYPEWVGDTLIMDCFFLRCAEISISIDRLTQNSKTGWRFCYTKSVSKENVLMWRPIVDIDFINTIAAYKIFRGTYSIRMEKMTSLSW